MSHYPRRIRTMRLLAPAAAAVLAITIGGAAWLAGCAANEPFDPDSVPNSPPLARIFVAPVDSGGELAPTSYYKARFAWSGTDRDGWVQEFYVSLRSPSTAAAPWDTTTKTDTTITLVTDETGNTDVTLLVACRDDRGALSDTVSRYLRIRNSPPEVVFQADFNPLANMQREVIGAGGAAPDTVYWNYGICNFRFNAYDRDNAATMDDFFRYTLVDGEPDVTWDADDPAADPEAGWIRVPFGVGEIKKCEVWLRGVSPGPRTLTISVRDEAQSDTRLQYSWEVRAPQAAVLWVPDNTSTIARAFYRELLDATYGAGNWDVFEFLDTFPDRASILLDTMRLFQAVMWTGGSSVSPALTKAATAGGVLQQYVIPITNDPPGRLLMSSRVVTGTNSTPAAFRSVVLKIGATGSPAVELRSFDGLQVLGVDATLPSLTCTNSFGRAIGLAPLAGCEWIYRFEECCARDCFGSTRPLSPCNPIVATRWPLRANDPLARVISVGLEPEYFDRAQAIAAYGTLLTAEMGVTAP